MDQGMAAVLAASIGGLLAGAGTFLTIRRSRTALVAEAEAAQRQAGLDRQRADAATEQARAATEQARVAQQQVLIAERHVRQQEESNNVDREALEHEREMAALRRRAEDQLRDDEVDRLLIAQITDAA